MRGGLDPLDAAALLRNVLQGLQSWLDVAASGKPQPQLPRAYVAHWHYQLGVVLALIDTPRPGHPDACPYCGRPGNGEPCAPYCRA
jgi:hypothetical protein